MKAKQTQKNIVHKLQKPHRKPAAARPAGSLADVALLAESLREMHHWQASLIERLTAQIQRLQALPGKKRS
jgi:hypothetical protein